MTETKTTTKFFLYEIRESDGNDCTVYDCVIEASDRDAADTMIGDHFEALAKERNWESDGNFGSYYFPCDCESPEEPTDDPSECETCEVLAINGVNCHEQGCPTFAKYKRDLRAFENAQDRDCSHGGITVDDYNVEEFDSEDAAGSACQRFHSRYTI